MNELGFALKGMTSALNVHRVGGGMESRALVQSVHGIRYQVKDVVRSVAFYTQHLGFKAGHQQLPAFASVSLGDVQMLLSGPGASGERCQSDTPVPGRVRPHRFAPLRPTGPDARRSG